MVFKHSCLYSFNKDIRHCRRNQKFVSSLASTVYFAIFLLKSQCMSVTVSKLAKAHEFGHCIELFHISVMFEGNVPVCWRSL